MKLTITAAGDLIIDTDDPHHAVTVARALRNSTAAAAEKKSHHKKKEPVPELESYDEPLSPQLVDAWNWLVANDTASGRRAEEMAEGLDINHHTAVYRLGQLLKKELIHRVRPGGYRAGSHADRR
jgi:hypothetical protein